MKGLAQYDRMVVEGKCKRAQWRNQARDIDSRRRHQDGWRGEEDAMKPKVDRLAKYAERLTNDPMREVYTDIWRSLALRVLLLDMIDRRSKSGRETR